MGTLAGMDATEAHICLMLDGWHQLSSSLNTNVIFNVYGRNGESLALLIDRKSHNVSDVVR